MQIKIANPCTEDINKMPETSCGRYCGACQKYVIDFSRLTDAELVLWLEKYPRACGIFSESQVNRDLPRIIQTSSKSGYRIWTVMLAFIAFFPIGEAAAQNQGQIKKKAHRDTTSGSVRLELNRHKTLTGAYDTSPDILKYLRECVTQKDTVQKKQNIFLRSRAWIRSRF